VPNSLGNTKETDIESLALPAADTARRVAIVAKGIMSRGRPRPRSRGFYLARSSDDRTDFSYSLGHSAILDPSHHATSPTAKSSSAHIDNFGIGGVSAARAWNPAWLGPHGSVNSNIAAMPATVTAPGPCNISLFA